MSSGPNVVQLLGAIAGSAVLTAVVNGLWGRRKMSADATSVIQKAAGGQVQVTSEDNARLRIENAEVHAKERATDHENALLRDVLRQQVAYSKRQSAVIRELGGVIEDPPPLPPELLNA